MPAAAQQSDYTEPFKVYRPYYWPVGKAISFSRGGEAMHTNFSVEMRCVGILRATNAADALAEARQLGHKAPIVGKYAHGVAEPQPQEQ